MDMEPHHIAGAWTAGSGAVLESTDPSTGSCVWRGNAASSAEVEEAVIAARRRLPGWSAKPWVKRAALLESFAARIEARREEFADRISRETGKPRWESLTEIDAMKAKIRFTIEAYRERREETVEENAGVVSATRFKPHGVTAVLGPFNLPGHLPNAHIAPALLAGNTVVFKPSEHAPLAGRTLVECWIHAGLPPGVLNLVQGGRETGAALSRHPGLNGLFFTGGFEGGRAIAESLAGRPGVIVALEMGGNNPLVVWEPCPMEAAVLLTLQSAFITAGQRCTCARRLIVPRGAFGDAFLNRLVRAVSRLVIGSPDRRPEPFFGPLISRDASDRLLEAWDSLLSEGGKSLLDLRRIEARENPGAGCGALVSPGVVDVTEAPSRPDRELFGPLLQVIRVADFSAAIREANHTAYGLSAGLLCENRDLWDRFYREIRAGIVNWNRPITGASGSQPFGGAGNSGNHRPSGFYAVDYCSYPVASTETDSLLPPAKLPPGISLQF